MSELLSSDLLPLTGWAIAATVLYAVASSLLVAAGLVLALLGGGITAMARPRAGGMALGAGLVLLAVGVIGLVLPKPVFTDAADLWPMVALSLSVALLAAGLLARWSGLRALLSQAPLRKGRAGMDDAASGGQRVGPAEQARSERHFQSAFHCSAVAMLITDQQGRLLRHNRAVADLVPLGEQAPEDAHGLVHPDDREPLARALSRAVTRGGARVELRLQAADGRTLWTATSIAAMGCDRHGHCDFVWQLQDVTERKAYEQTLREARDRADRLVTARTEELARTNKRLARANARLARLAGRDELTGIANRRQLDQQLARAVAEANRHGQSLSVLMIDIDHFKAINDAHGHRTGDQVLISATQAITEVCRQSDLLARYGGDELCLVLPHTGETQMCAVAHKIHQRIRDMEVPDDNGQPVAITASIGGAGNGHDQANADELLERADRALYRAKEQGRDRVVSAADLALATVHPLNAGPGSR